ncbi:MAG: Ig domain-containing protein, partial [Cyanobium sp.]
RQPHRDPLVRGRSRPARSAPGSHPAPPARGWSLQGQIASAQRGSGNQDDLWILDLNAALAAKGGVLAAGATIERQTVQVRPASVLSTTPGSSRLAKLNLGHGIYALPYPNTPPTLAIAGAADPEGNLLPAAAVGQPWTATLEAADGDGSLFFWQLVKAPAGLRITPSATVERAEPGYATSASLSWTPTANDRVDSEVVVRVVDSRGGVALRRFSLPVAGANHLPTIEALGEITLKEGESLNLPLGVADADGDRLAITLRNLPAGARYDAGSGALQWTPSYDQAGTYNDVTIVASDGKHTVVERFNLHVEQGYARPVLGPLGEPILREGERFALQLPGSMPGGLSQADGTRIRL